MKPICNYYKNNKVRIEKQGTNRKTRCGKKNKVRKEKQGTKRKISNKPVNKLKSVNQQVKVYMALSLKITLVP